MRPKLACGVRPPTKKLRARIATFANPTADKSSCEAFDVRMNGDMTMVLLATRKKSGSVRDHMRLLRTNLINWGVALPTKQKGWLRVVTDEGNSDGAAPEAADAPSNPFQNMPQTSNRSLLTLPPNLLTIPIASH